MIIIDNYDGLSNDMEPNPFCKINDTEKKENPYF